MDKRKKGMFYSLWTAAILVVLILALFAILFASCSEAKEEVPVTTETPPVAETPPPVESSAEPTPAETPVPTVLAETEDAGQEYVDKFVFLGDSTTYSLLHHQLVQNTQVWTPASGTLTLDKWNLTAIMNWGTGEELMLTELLDAAQPEYMLITLGVNGVSFLNEENFTLYYTALVEAVKEHSPNTRIILNSIYPVAASYIYLDSINNEKITAANGWIQAIAQSTGVRYLDSASVLKGADGFLPEDSDMDDGIHLNSEAMQSVLTYLRTHAYQ